MAAIRHGQLAPRSAHDARTDGPGEGRGAGSARPGPVVAGRITSNVCTWLGSFIWNARGSGGAYECGYGSVCVSRMRECPS